MESKSIPNPQIVDAADQFYDAALLLMQQPPGSGVLLPLLMVSTFSLELYLKALNALDVSTPTIANAYIVTAKSAIPGHVLVDLFDKLDNEIKDELEKAFCTLSLNTTLISALGRYNTLFIDSRYMYEKVDKPQSLDIDNLIRIVKFMHDFLADMTKRIYGI